MNLRFFIDRPVFSIVISVVIVLLGIISRAFRWSSIPT
jgi:HAE1 family hydrophobic/amphiphilic exporter-1